MSTTYLNALAFEGGGVIGGGGGDFDKNDVAAISQLITEGGVKRALIHYLETVDLSKIDNPVVEKVLVPLVSSKELLKDIEVKDNYIVSENCSDSNNTLVPAAAYIGDVGGKICFNAQKISEKIKGLSDEQRMIELSALALHEHIHHFQKNKKEMVANEQEAYEISGYLKNTARFLEIPVLKWDLDLINTLPSHLFGDYPAKFSCVWVDNNVTDCNIPTVEETDHVLKAYEQGVTKRLKDWEDFNKEFNKIDYEVAGKSMDLIKTYGDKAYKNKLLYLYAEYFEYLGDKLDKAIGKDYTRKGLRVADFKSILDLGSPYHQFLKGLKKKIPYLTMEEYARLIKKNTDLLTYEWVFKSLNKTLEELVRENLRPGDDIMPIAKYLNLSYSCQDVNGIGSEDDYWRRDINKSNFSVSIFKNDISLDLRADEVILRKLVSDQVSVECEKNQDVPVSYSRHSDELLISYRKKYVGGLVWRLESPIYAPEFRELLRKVLK